MIVKSRQGSLMMMSIFCIVLSGIAQASLTSDRAIGWHWYNEIQKTKEIKETKETKSKTMEKVPQKKPLTATQKMTAFRNLIREAKDQAILYPTEQNVRFYILLQNIAVQNASRFSNMWQKTLLDDPSLDYGVLHPTENNAQHVIYTKRDQAEQKAIQYYRQKYGLFFFYRGKALLDQTLAPSIEQFSQTSKIALIPVSIDGTLLSSLPGSKLDKGQAEKLGIQYFPALMLVNPETHKVIPLNYGFISGDELKNRFLEVATNFREGV